MLATTDYTRLFVRERGGERRWGGHIVCANDIWIERAFRRPDTDTMAPISTFLDGGMIRPGSGLWDSLSSPGNTRKLFATGSLDHFNVSHENDVPFYHRHDMIACQQMPVSSDSLTT